MTTYTREEFRELGDSIISESAVIADILYQLAEAAPAAWIHVKELNLFKSEHTIGTAYSRQEGRSVLEPLYQLPIKESNDN